LFGVLLCLAVVPLGAGCQCGAGKSFDELDLPHWLAERGFSPSRHGPWEWEWKGRPVDVLDYLPDFSQTDFSEQWNPYRVSVVTTPGSRSVEAIVFEWCQRAPFHSDVTQHPLGDAEDISAFEGELRPWMRARAAVTGQMVGCLRDLCRELAAEDLLDWSQWDWLPKGQEGMPPWRATCERRGYRLEYEPGGPGLPLPENGPGYYELLIETGDDRAFSIFWSAWCSVTVWKAAVRDAGVYEKWPFDAKEAKRRQKETAEALDIPVEKSIDLPGGANMEFVLIPAGEFLMGSKLSAAEVAKRFGSKESFRADEHPAHRVRLTRPFYIGKYEVTQEQWQAMMGENPSKFTGARNPAEQVSWNECQELLRKLRFRSDGLTLALPTEAEWEYACRAGTATPFHTGETIPAEQANCEPGQKCESEGNRASWPPSTVPVGSFRPNAFGLHDMHGNVREWCQDWYGEKYYQDSPREDPTGPATGPFRVLRGGSWLGLPWTSRSAARAWFHPTAADFKVGCRIVLRDFR